MALPTVAERVRRATAAIGKGANFAGMCEKFTRGHFGFPARYASARLARIASQGAGGWHAGDYNAPAGVPVFFDLRSGKNASYDHVAISVGGGYCISTSAGPGGTVAKVRIKDLERAWAGVGCDYQGWAEIYHGQRVYTKPKASTPPKQAPSGGLTIPGVTSSRDYPYAAMSTSSTASNLDKGWATLLYAAGYRTRYLKDRMRKWLQASNVAEYGGPAGTAKAHDKAQMKALQRVLRSRRYYLGAIDGTRGPLTRAGEAKWLNSQAPNVVRIIRTGK